MSENLTAITSLLQQLAAGQNAAADRVYELLYPELKRLARSHLHGAGPITLDPTAMIHEVWLRSQGQLHAGSRRQFFAHASVVMRSVIIDHVRERQAQKRGGGVADVTLGTAELESLAEAPDVLRLDDTLKLLERVDPRAHRVVEMRFFAGMTLEEIAAEMELSVPTLKRDWRRARAFLFEQLSR